MFARTFFAALVALIAVQVSAEDVPSLNADTIDAFVAKDAALIKFFAPWCGHCKNMAPAYIAANEKLAAAGIEGSLGEVDCTVNSAVCSKYDVKGYPTLLFFSKGENVEKYSKGRTEDAIIEFIKSKSGAAPAEEEKAPAAAAPAEGVPSLTADTFDAFVAKDAALVKFFAPWCGHCKNMAPAYKAANEKLNAAGHQSTLAEVDCTVQKDVCSKYEVKGYPTLLFFSKGENVEKYSKGRTEDAFIEFIKSKSGAPAAEAKEAPAAAATDGVPSLTADTFESFVAKDAALVKFFAPWCGHCKNMAPAYKAANEKLNAAGHKSTLAEVDCTVQKDVCSKYEVRGYPTLLFFSKGENVEKYSKGRTEDALIEFIKSKSGAPAAEAKEAAEGVPSLSSATFDSFVAKDAALVKFFAPWCGHCKNMAPAYKAADAKLAAAGLKNTLAEVDCTVEKELCTKHGVKGYPTLLFFSKGENVEKYSKGRTEDAFIEFIKSKSGAPAAEAKEAPAAAATDGVPSLTADTFDSFVAKDAALVKFFAPWCGHCKNMAPAYKAANEKLEAAGIKGSLAEVDCTVQKDLCTKHGVKGYPTLLFFSNGENVEKYSKGRTEDVFIEFIKSKSAAATDGLPSLTADTFDAFVAKDAALVKFFAPWCGHCKKMAPAYKAANEKLVAAGIKGSLGEVDCTKQSDVCSAHGVKGYPTLLFFSKGENVEKYSIARTEDALIEFIKSKTGASAEEEKAAPAAEELTANGNVVVLTESNFDAQIKSAEVALVKFFAPWCGHCKSLAPHYKEAATKLKTAGSKALIAEVDCTVENSLSKYAPDGYPTVLLFKNGEEIEEWMGSDRTADGIVSYVNKAAGVINVEENNAEAVKADEAVEAASGELTYDDDVMILTEGNFEKQIKANPLMLIKVYAPWCGHCKALAPFYKEAAAQLKAASSTAVLAEVDATVQESLKKLAPEGYPTVLLYKDGKEVEEWMGQRSTEDIVNYMNKHAGAADAATDDATADDTHDEL
ncbi:hypothetical protein SARC_00945 [Sphaeroforma arctica JP610]|uniref:Thioredoxin domain-containing protein n=1 Tax=Sphaeroforma arctica JP610 TaxID=667725 RepID=A0A0L0GD07_9EUKA|nr:hypothetical protein SARC_00945 [Sphaeroforma arctica JP610]KNC86900.1 hypothetical protein SARC_00945 [Sphaeroforma arctica JP610]|eukprot:XP_014160802.1 hypothetical protein SARC_00945 [Sphaeroforma arctica JP610]